MTTKTYNGWSNYETWAVKLWMDNDEGSYRYWQEITRETWKDAEADANFTRMEAAALALANTLKEQHNDNTPTVTGVYADLLNAALSEVDWLEIANALLDDGEYKDESEDE